MKEYLYRWIQDIAFYTLLMTVVLHVLPDQKQEKYLQFFMGIVLIILVISPALSFTGLDRKLDETYARQTYDQELQEFLRRQEAMEETYREYVEERLSNAKEELEAQEETEERDDLGGQGEARKGESIGIPEIQIEIGGEDEAS